MLLFVFVVVWQSILMHDNTWLLGFFLVPGFTRVHPACLLQKADDEDKSLFTDDLLYFSVAREVKEAISVYTNNLSGAICEIIRGNWKLKDSTCLLHAGTNSESS